MPGRHSGLTFFFVKTGKQIFSSQKLVNVSGLGNTGVFIEMYPAINIEITTTVLDAGLWTYHL